MARNDLSEKMMGERSLLEFVGILRDVARRKGVPLEAISRLGKKGGDAIVEMIVDIAHADWRAEQSSVHVRKSQGEPPRRTIVTLGSPPICLEVDYRQRTMRELRKQFTNVDPSYATRRFSPMRGHEAIKRKNGKISIEYVYLEPSSSISEGYERLERRGLRPCLQEELFSYDAQSDEGGPLVALGTVAPSTLGNFGPLDAFAPIVSGAAGNRTLYAISHCSNLQSGVMLVGVPRER